MPRAQTAADVARLRGFPRMTLYEQLAGQVRARILSGGLAPGARLPSVRELRRAQALSQATVLQAYALLEQHGWVESRPRSGYFVAQRPPIPPPPAAPVPSVPAAVEVSELVFHILEATRARRVLPFGSAFPSPLLFPLDALGRELARVARTLDPWATVADLPPGSLALREEISRRYLRLGVDVPAEGILITNGALEALNLSLQALTQPGDVLAVESPSFYAALQAAERLGLRVVEVPTDAQCGVDPDALRDVLDRHPVRACWFMSRFQNPLGASVPDDARQAIVALLAERGVPLIEDDVYAELQHGARGPRPYKSADRGGGVLHCSSFSKCLAPGWRVGWVAAGRHAPQLERLKAMTSLATNIPAQEALAAYLRRGGFELHLRGLRRRLAAQQAQMLDGIAAHFPPGTRATRAQGGYFTWVELPAHVDALALHRRASAEGIGLSPGPMFSPHRGYRNCVRLNYGHPFDDALLRGLARLGALAHEAA